MVAAPALNTASVLLGETFVVLYCSEAEAVGSPLVTVMKLSDGEVGTSLVVMTLVVVA